MLEGAMGERPIIERIKVEPATVTVLGYKVRATDPSWTGLDLSRAEPRTQSSIMLHICGSDEAPRDVHLNVPWCHPDDQTGSADDFDCRYRVRPRMEPGKNWKGRRVRGVDFERWDGTWYIVVEYWPPIANPPSGDGGKG
jgi:hypothetical protein